MNESEKARQKKLQERFETLFGAPSEAMFSAAGRVNLIGEHVDYCGGRVLPAALGLACLVLARRNGTHTLRIAATTIEARAEIDLERTEDYRGLPWGNYQAGVAHVMREAGYRLVGCDILYDCSVPFGAGLSSSAAIEVATAYTLARLGENPIDKVALAVLAKRAENEYCGVNCGIMDQYASANGVAGQALLLDCATLACERIPLDLRDCVLVLADCRKPHHLVTSRYNERRFETEEALRILAPKTGAAHLAEVTEEELERYRDLLSPVVYRRARHVVTEVRRVGDSVACLRRGDLTAFGRLLDESHASLKNDYEATGFELDTLAEAARDAAGCLGSRMTGAGFGGCTVSLVRADCAEAFRKQVGVLYAKETGYRAIFYETEIADGIREYPLV